MRGPKAAVAVFAGRVDLGDITMSEPRRIETGTWIVVADGEKALFLENVGDAQDYHFQVRRIEEQDNPPNRDQGADRPGRQSDGPSGHYSAVEETDWHRLEKERFARGLADMLYKSAHANRYSALVIVASPQVLGEMRGNLHVAVQERLVAEIPKTLTNHQLDEVEKSLRREFSAG